LAGAGERTVCGEVLKLVVLAYDGGGLLLLLCLGRLFFRGFWV
jgi:hypothetical protein